MKKILKAILLIIIEIVILVCLVLAGVKLDEIIMAPKGETVGHPIPIFTMILPCLGMLVMFVIDIVLLIAGIVSARKNKKN